MTENELEAWMAEQRDKRRLKLMRLSAEKSIDRGFQRSLFDPREILELLGRLGA